MEEKKILKVKMLGRFSLKYGKKDIILDRNIAAKTVQLMELVCLGGKEGVSKQSLIDSLYGRDQVENKNGSLNNTIFRLRKQLCRGGLPESSYIVVSGGMCYWAEEDIPLETDCLNFERVVEMAEKTDDPEEQKEIYLKACSLYTGEFLPELSGEDWAAVQNIRYQELYFGCLKNLMEIFRQEGEYEKIRNLACQAEEIYPFGEWQLYRIDSLIAMGKYKEATEIYEKTSKMYFEELGLKPSAEMLKRFELMGQKLSHSESALEDIRQRLKEKDEIQGAYYCSFPSFVDIYNIVGRMMERNGIQVFIILCTLKDRHGKILGEKERGISRQYRKAIHDTLRKGDFYTKYNYGQYLVVLSGISQKNCKIVSERIDETFAQISEKTGCRAEYYVASVEEVCKDLLPGEIKFGNYENCWLEK